MSRAAHSVLYCVVSAHCSHDCIIGIYENENEKMELLYNFIAYNCKVHGLYTYRDFTYGSFFEIRSGELSEEQYTLLQEIREEYSDDMEVEIKNQNWGPCENALQYPEFSEVWICYYLTEDESLLAIQDEKVNEKIYKIICDLEKRET